MLYRIRSALGTTRDSGGATPLHLLRSVPLYDTQRDGGPLDSHLGVSLCRTLGAIWAAVKVERLRLSLHAREPTSLLVLLRARVVLFHLDALAMVTVVARIGWIWHTFL